MLSRALDVCHRSAGFLHSLLGFHLALILLFHVLLPIYFLCTGNTLCHCVLELINICVDILSINS